MANTQKLLIGGLILMVVLNLCTLGFILFKPHHGHHRGGHGDQWGDHRGFGDKRGGGPFKELNLTAEQETKLNDLKVNLDSKMDSLRQQADKLRKAQFALLKSDQVDPAIVNKQAAEIGNCFTEMEKLTFKHFSDIKKVLTKEQQAGFNKFVEEMGSRRHGPHGFMKGGGHDRGGDRHRGEGGDRRGDRQPDCSPQETPAP